MATTDWIKSAFQDKPIRFPALFIVNFETMQLYPMSIGYINEPELIDYIRNLLSKILL